MRQRAAVFDLVLDDELVDIGVDDAGGAGRFLGVDAGAEIHERLAKLFDVGGVFLRRGIAERLVEQLGRRDSADLTGAVGGFDFPNRAVRCGAAGGEGVGRHILGEAGRRDGRAHIVGGLHAAGGK